MSKLRGLFDNFVGIENISIENVIAYFGGRVDPRILENEVANRILYPQVIPESLQELALDLVILREALKNHPRDYYNRNLKRIIIPEFFLTRFPDLQNLIGAFVDAYLPPGVTTIFIKSEDMGMKKIGSIIKPDVLRGDGWIYFEVDGKKYQVKPGSLVSIPGAGNQVEVKFESKVAALNGKSNITIAAPGGQMGLLIDTRKLKHNSQ